AQDIVFCLPDVPDGDEISSTPTEMSITECFDLSNKWILCIFNTGIEGRNYFETESDTCQVYSVETECEKMIEKMEEVAKCEELKFFPKDSIDSVKLKAQQESSTLNQTEDEAVGDRYVEKDLLPSSPGKVVLVKDKETDKVWIEKKIPLDSEYSAAGVRSWRALAKEKMAPVLYRVLFKDNYALYTMEYIDGATLNQVLLSGKMKNQEDDRRLLAILVSIFFLKCRNFLGKLGIPDLRASNVMVTCKLRLSFRLIDFDKHPKQYCDADTEKIKNVEEIISLIVCVYCGNKVGQACGGRSKDEIKDLIQQLKEKGHQDELWKIVKGLKDSISKDSQDKDFPNTDSVEKYLEQLLPEDLDSCKERLRSMIFPDILEKDYRDQSKKKPEMSSVDEKEADVQEMGLSTRIRLP
ncbi:hypothetical protein RRG08_066733, partial [Elysia crispata]